MDIELIRSKLSKYGQEHLIAYWDDLNDKQKQSLLQDINEIDLARTHDAYQHIKSQLMPPLSSNKNEQQNGAGDNKQQDIDRLMEPIPEHLAGSVYEATQKELDEYNQEGSRANDKRSLSLRAIADGEVCVLLLAGGQGTRLGVNYPKGMYNVNLLSQKSLYQIQAERIIRLQELANEQYGKICQIPWFIMTSEHTQQATEDYFHQHNYFGLKQENIILFEQHILPALNFQGKILLDEKYKLTKAPDGNGGLYRALCTRGILNEMVKRQIKYVHVYCVDNILVKMADPIFIGFCLKKNANCAAKVVKKNSPNEAVGVICKVNNRFQVVEYSEISSDTAQRRKPDGELLFNAGNICNHFFSVNFLQAVCKDHENELRYHVAKKAIPCLGENGLKIESPKEPNGVKLEKFVFDVFPFSKTFAVWEVKREEEFSPLKNGKGSKDTPATCRRDLMAEHLRWLKQAGVEVPNIDKFTKADEPLLELSPLVSYAGENLEFLKDYQFELPFLLECNSKKKLEVNGKELVKSAFQTNGLECNSTATMNGVHH
ncbi:unnamed protein product [Didymodactylos carnosus]|uniref:UDP-N-acetylglucosamine diphosphorylase n=1 Tax=Didymodactylos carnosus TaxID=1234261 RepID=A0A813PAZ1_9BILA|nr:unnamed protein product [Didymodactylos carnosus]CAF1194753.1 unnamed protein product [Didymodactylos carnosus]CAF3530333.1 unnamed protein product [Didymodactylos carnosus]CAF4005031.1 unnamed protein product [Didymodactylos carnosus]